MQRLTLLDKILLAKPTHRMAVEWPTLIIVALLGEIFSWSKIPFSPYSNIIGGIVIVGAWMFHAYCHRAHHRAHKQSSSIESVQQTVVIDGHCIACCYPLIDVFEFDTDVFWLCDCLGSTMDFLACIPVLNIDCSNRTQGRGIPGAEIRFSIRRVHAIRPLAIHTQNILKELV